MLSSISKKKEKEYVMISYIKGELIEVLEDRIIIECQGIGYNIFVPMSVLDNLPMIGENIKIHTYMHIREDAMILFGFSNRDDLQVFKLLLAVNGIGPKGAIGILSTMTSDDLRFAVLGDDVQAISKAPGIGTKTAKKLILELKDKFKLEDAVELKTLHMIEKNDDRKSDKKSEAILALTALGYSKTEAVKAVSKVTIIDDMEVEDILKIALRHI